MEMMLVCVESSMPADRQKVVLVTNSLMVGGLCSVIVEQAHAFDRAGCEVHVVLLNSNSEAAEESPCSVHYLPLSDSNVRLRHRVLYALFRPFLKGIGNWFSARYNCKRFNQFLRELGVACDDVVILHGFRTVVSLRQFDHPGLIKVMHEMQSDHVGPFGGGLGALRAYFVRACYVKGARVAVSEAVKLDYREKIKGKGAVEVISNGINSARVIALSEASKGPCFSRPYIVSVGRLVPVKGFDVLIRAFGKSAISKTHDLVIVGEGKELDGLAALANEVGVPEKIHFPGYISPPFSIVRKADLYVGASYHEGFGLALLEAIALGVPVMASRVSGFEEIVRHCGGVMFEAGDVDGLSELLDQFKPGVACEDGLALDRYGFDALVKQYLRLRTKES
ncbi:glycosyltransferase [uncultured Alcanivorax sp.]|uniref:glycosyltransferase n=1 Tax=uncultured Alcanivorax sp. TaxID=191215 RepID=UPI0032B10BDB